MKLVYDAKDLFEKNPDNEEDILMNIPAEVCEAANLNPNDTINIEATDDGKIILTKVNRGKHEN